MIDLLDISLAPIIFSKVIVINDTKSITKMLDNGTYNRKISNRKHTYY